MSGPHWTDAYYGDLYFDSAADLLTPALSGLEAELIAGLLGLGPGDRVLDAACGHGRHAHPLARRGAKVVGLERSRRYLARAIGDHGGIGAPPAWVRGDVRALPFRDGAFDAAYSWYASLFMYDDAGNLECLAGLGRVVRPGGRLLVQHANPSSLDAAPLDSSRRVLPDGSVVEEDSRWDADAGIDRCARRLVRPDGAVLSGTAELRYYRRAEWGELARAAGLRLVRVTSTPLARPEAGGPAREPPDLIALLERPA